MYLRNNGKGESNMLQNRFTAYLLTAVHRKKEAYLWKRAYLLRNEETIDFQTTPLESISYMERFPVEEAFENAALEQMLRQISPRDRYIFLEHLLNECSYEELGAQLGLSYQGVASAYHRVLRRLRDAMREGRTNEF